MARLINKNDPDRKWYHIPGLTDKGNHKAYGAAVFAIVWAFAGLWWAMAAVILAAFAWEYAWYWVGRKFDWSDIEATVLGGVYAGAAITAILKLVKFILWIF